MELEKLATSAVVTEISKTDLLSSFINSGDKEPCWDGHIYIHEDKKRTKKNIKKVATQIKGKEVQSKQVKRTINYSIEYDDLYAYMMNGGTMFFVVYLDKETGDPLQIYYSNLLPIKIRELFKVKKKKYSVKFRKFPSDKLQKTELMINFYEDARRQASFAGKELPSIDDLAKQGVLESLSINYTGLGDYDTEKAFPKMIEGQSVTVYANIKGGTAPIPVEYHDTISKVTMSNKNTLPISVKGRLFYAGFQTVATADNIEHHIGTALRIIFPNTGKKDKLVSGSIKVRIHGTLTQRITAIEFMLAILEHGSFTMGTHEIPVTFPPEERERLESCEFPELLDNYKKVKTVLDSMNIKKDLEIEKCTDEDIDKINILVGTIGEKLPMKGTPEKPEYVQKVAIANLTLALVYLNKSKDSYCIYDYFGNHFDVTWNPEGTEPVKVSQFFSLSSEDYLTLDNMNLQTVVDDYKNVEVSPEHIELVNTAVLNMIKAYDEKALPELLDAAKQLCEWLQGYPDMISSDVVTLNRLQIVLRERVLTYQEKAVLHKILNSATDKYLRIGAFLLLDEQHEANTLLDSLGLEEREPFLTFPICKFLSRP